MRFLLAAFFVVFALPAYALSPIDIEARATVRIGNGSCSGVIIVAGSEKAYGVSAAHCAASVNQQFAVHFADGRKSNGRWVSIDRSVDLALFTVWSRDVLGVAPVRLGLPDGDFSARAVGYPAGQGPNVKDLALAAYVPPRNAFRIKSGRGWGGDSGGGVFVDGKLIGVVSHMAADGAGRYKTDGPNGGPGVLYCSQNQQLVNFCRLCEPQMPAGCRDNWCWTPRPNVPIDTRPLPDLDSDDDRQRALQAVLDRLDGVDTQIDELNSQQVDANSAIAELQSRLDAIEARVNQNAESLAAVSDRVDSNSSSLNQVTTVLAKLADSTEELAATNAKQDNAIIALQAAIDRIAGQTITVEILDRDGKVIDRETYQSGDPLRFQFGARVNAK